MLREAAKVVGATDGRERDRELDEPQLLRPQVPRQDVRAREPDRADRGKNFQPSFKGNFIHTLGSNLCLRPRDPRPLTSGSEFVPLA